jgi:hypothetical protein
MAAVTRLGLHGGPRGLYGSFEGKELAVVVVETSTGGGRGSKRRNKYPRRVVINGVVYWVSSAAEERVLLAQHQASVEAEALLLAVSDAPAEEVKAAKVRVQRVQRRIEATDTREADWMEYLLQEDEEIISLVLH